jgi:riboflavin synthase
MFTGIIETLAKLEHTEKEQSNVHFTFSSSITPELKVDQSVAHNGVCLTVVKIHNEQYTVTAIDETLQKTNLGHLQIGNLVNLERCMAANGRFDGHIVQGHVDETGTVIKAEVVKGIGGGCDEAALNAILKTKFTPGKQRGKPIKVQVTVPVLFKL